MALTSLPTEPRLQLPGQVLPARALSSIRGTAGIEHVAVLNE